jgi:single-strand DNA-binding protein
MINRVALTGRLTRDVELRYTQSGVAAGSFTLAVDRQFTNQNNEREADFINCVIWRKSAENFANFTHKGALVGIDGRIQTRNYENKQGQRVYVTEVVVDNFALLEPKSSNGAGQSNSNGNTGNSGNGANAQANSGNTSDGYQDPFANNGDEIDISDDQLPF